MAWILTELLPRCKEGGGEGGGSGLSADGRVVALHGVLGLSHVALPFFAGAIASPTTALLL